MEPVNYNETVLAHNNDLRAALKKANALAPAGGTTEDLTAELAEQASLIAANQAAADNNAALIEQIMEALEGKAAGGGVTLPELTNPASPAEIMSGYEAIDGEGNVMVGTMEEQSGGTESCVVTLNMYEGMVYYVDSTGSLMAENAAGEPTIQVAKNSILVARAGVLISSSGGVNYVFRAADTEEEDYAYVFFVAGNGSVSC